MIMYTVHTTDPTNYQLCWQKCDDLSREALTCILGRPLNGSRLNFQLNLLAWV
jgi:hypothetical protein